MNDTIRPDRGDAARAILARNDRGGYTVPTDRLYPFQWNWDSAFVAMGFATFDPDRAYRELERLAEGQWDDGMIPHIVFHAPSDTYFPGPDVWGTRHRIPTSGITQPPVFGMALRQVHEAATAAGRTDAMERTRVLFGHALRSHRWWMRARDPDGTGLVAILHPWESGSDNSPAWDEAMARVPTSTTTVIRRKDTGHVDASMRPKDVDYQRFIHLVDTYRDCGWDAARQWDAAPFKIAEVQMTAILARATRDLVALAEILGLGEEGAELSAMADRLTQGLTTRWRSDLGRFVSRDLISGQDVDAPTQAGFVRSSPSLSIPCSARLPARSWRDGAAAWWRGSPRPRRSRPSSSPSATGAVRSGPSSTGSSRTACATTASRIRRGWSSAGRSTSWRAPVSASISTPRPARASAAIRSHGPRRRIWC